MKVVEKIAENLEILSVEVVDDSSSIVSLAEDYKIESADVIEAKTGSFRERVRAYIVAGVLSVIALSMFVTGFYWLFAGDGVPVAAVWAACGPILGGLFDHYFVVKGNSDD